MTEAQTLMVEALIGGYLAGILAAWSKAILAVAMTRGFGR